MQQHVVSFVEEQVNPFMQTIRIVATCECGWRHTVTNQRHKAHEEMSDVLWLHRGYMVCPLCEGGRLDVNDLCCKRCEGRGWVKPERP